MTLQKFMLTRRKFCLTFTILVLISVLYFLADYMVYRRQQMMVFPEYNSRTTIFPDYISLVDLPDFRYQMNIGGCQKNQVFVLILVHSAPAHFDNRETIRRTWGNVSVDAKQVRTVFLVAEVQDADLQTALYAENEKHGDLVQGNFLDSYRNLTYKHIMGLMWLSDFCATAKFAIKMDDDIFIDIYKMIQLIDNSYRDGLTSSLGCCLMAGTSVLRNKNSKWYVSESEYSLDIYGDYCSGWAYILSPAVAEKLVFNSKFLKFFWIDDVYVTGRVATRAGVKRDNLNRIYTFSIDSLRAWTKSKECTAWKYTVGPTDLILMEEAHKKATRCWNEKLPVASIPNNGSLKGIR